ncbi:MAG: Tfp pilus assembly PilM family ATPase, partial [Myxococcota bacterium]
MPLVYGVDLGAHTIKISVLEGSFGRYQVLDYRLRAVPQSLDEPPSRARRLAALADVVSELETERAQFAAAYPAELTSLRMIKLPFSDKAKIDQTL